MAEIVIRFVNSENSFIGRAIDWATNSLVDHVEFQMPDWTWAAAHYQDGVQIHPNDYMTPTTEWRYCLECTDQQRAALTANINKAIGTPYDLKDIAGLLFHDRAMNNPHAVICSQFVIQQLAKVGIWMLNVIPEYMYLVTPDTLHLSPLLIGRCIYRFPEVNPK